MTQQYLNFYRHLIKQPPKNWIYETQGICIFNCDNIELLHTLPSDSINLIYCDILYNTGKKFDDYNDNLGSPQEAVEWYRPRMEEMRRVLASNGSIFIHCNWRLDSYIRILMDEIFGGDCFRNRIYRKHSGKRGFYNNFDSQVDIILYYVKDKRNFVFHEQTTNSKQIAPLFENGIREAVAEDIREANGIEFDPASRRKHWIVSKKQFKEMKEKNQIVSVNSLPYRVSNVSPVGNLWDETEMLDKFNRTSIDTAYDTPKPDAVLERIITMCSNEGDVVADFFMGGGTTAVLTKKLNRFGIFCDINPKACEVTVSKLKRV